MISIKRFTLALVASLPLVLSSVAVKAQDMLTLLFLQVNSQLWLLLCRQLIW